MATASRTGTLLRSLVVRRAPRRAGEAGPRGFVRIGTASLTCALGNAGISHAKREGDRATPVGRMNILRGLYRPDRSSRPFCRIPLSMLTPSVCWCDDPGSPLYNRQVPLPPSASHETMWRSDELYDIVFVLDYNLSPRRAGRGSAIFLHCARPGFRPTLGCIALRPADLRRLLPRLARDARLIVR